MNRRTFLGHSSMRLGLCFAGAAKSALSASTKSSAGAVAQNKFRKIRGESARQRST